MFIKTPEVLFEFPLLAIGLDWLELALILKSKSALTPETYLATHKRLKRIFFAIAGLVISAIIFDVLCNTLFVPGDNQD